MITAYITLFIALSISAVAAFYSIAGLIAIFSAAVIPIAIMGAVLESGKIATTVWLHKNWKVAPKLLKGYFLTAVITLMFITSMGIFGYLSKAHINQGTGLGASQLKIEQLEIKIQSEKRIVEAGRRQISMLDESLDRYIELGAVTKSLKKRDEQEPERKQLNKSITSAQTRLDGYLSEKATLDLEIKNFEAEVGPVKYIAELLYGDGETSHIEDAVRFVILVLVFVFDPLAVLMLIAANMSIEMELKERKKQEQRNNPKPKRRAQPKRKEEPTELTEEEFKKYAKKYLTQSGKDELEIVIDENNIEDVVVKKQEPEPIQIAEAKVNGNQKGLKKVVKSKNGISMEYFE